MNSETPKPYSKKEFKIMLYEKDNHGLGRMLAVFIHFL
jgi:hypothetical protein